MSGPAPGPRQDGRAPALLLADLDEALCSEFGARAIYRLLAQSERDAELARLCATFADEATAQIERLAGLIELLGGRPRRHCRRRELLARVLHAGRRLGARRFALRLCRDAQATLERRYLGVGQYLAEAGPEGGARRALELARTKGLQAHALSAWLEHGDHPAGPPRRR